jgi:hypothetical protein
VLRTKPIPCSAVGQTIGLRDLKHPSSEISAHSSLCILAILMALWWERRAVRIVSDATQGDSAGALFPDFLD